MDTLNLEDQTLLDALNTMLVAIGSTPVEEFDTEDDADAVVCRQILTETSREVQSKGWRFNTDRKVELQPGQVTKQITLNSNVVRVDVHKDRHREQDITVRGSLLYDRLNHTYEFDAAVIADVVTLRPWEELPEVCKDYIVIRSARRFAERRTGSETISSFTLRDEMQAWMSLRRNESIVADRNMLTNAPALRR